MRKHCCFKADKEVEDEPPRKKRSKPNSENFCTSSPDPGYQVEKKTFTRLNESEYTNWNAKVETAVYLPWYKTRKLIYTLKSIRKINPNDAKAKIAALQKLNDLNDAAPFTRYKRFPESCYALERGELAQELQNLRCVLEMTTCLPCLRQKRKNRSDDVFRICGFIMKQLVTGVSVYDRKKFELCFDVKWTEEKPKGKEDSKTTSSVEKRSTDINDDKEDPCKRKPSAIVHTTIIESRPLESNKPPPRDDEKSLFLLSGYQDRRTGVDKLPKTRNNDFDGCCTSHPNPEHNDKKEMVNSRYTNWNAKVIAVGHLPWYKSSELICTLRAVRKINKSDPEAKAAALEKLKNLNSTTPFSRYKRFPKCYYILGYEGPLVKKLEQLRYVLETQDCSSFPCPEKKSRSPCKMFNIFRICNNILLQLVKGNHAYDRKRFEKSFDVTWTEVEQDSEQKQKPESSKDRAYSRNKRYTNDHDGKVRPR